MHLEKAGDVGLSGPAMCHAQAPSGLEVGGPKTGPQSPCGLTDRLGVAEM